MAADIDFPLFIINFAYLVYFHRTWRLVLKDLTAEVAEKTPRSLRISNDINDFLHDFSLRP